MLIQAAQSFICEVTQDICLLNTLKGKGPGTGFMLASKYYFLLTVHIFTHHHWAIYHSLTHFKLAT
jgi:hypothetical protein